MNPYNKIIKFNTPSGVIFNKPSTKSPEARGPFTAQRSYIIPKITVIAGSILTALYNSNEKAREIINKDFSWENIEEIDRVMKDELKISIYGPIIFNEKDNDYEIYVNLYDYLVRLDYLKNLLENSSKEESKLLEFLHKKIKRKERYWFLKDRYEKNDIDIINITKIHKIGIALENNRKIVKEGYLYSQEVLFLENIRNFEKFVISVLVNDENSMLESINNKPVRFGAKGRIAKINVENNSINNRIFKDEYRFGVLISDAIVSLNIKEIENKRYQDILETIKKDISEKYKFEIMYGDIEYTSLGWDIKRDIPKPYTFRIRAGSIIKINSKNPEHKVGELKNLGFGSFIPF